jgi:hypothetical protein
MTERDDRDDSTETDRLMTDGGARREDYWEQLASDGGDAERTASEETPLSILRSEIDSSETLHSVIPTERDGETIVALVLRETPARSGDGSVLHLRYARIDREERRVAWSDNGMFVGREGNTPSALIKAFAGVRDGTSEESTQAINGLGAGTDDLARDLLAEPIEDDDEPVDHSKETVESSTSTNRVECQKCGRKGPIDDMENFGGGLVDSFVHSGGCPDE